MEFRDYAAREVTELAERLTKAAATAVDLAAKKAADEGQKAAECLRAEMQATIKKVSEDGQKVAETLRGELQATVKQKMALTASVKEAQAQLETVRGELKTVTERGDVASRQLAEARKANEKLEALRDDLTAERDEIARARVASEAELKKTREALEGTRAELTSALKKVEKAVADRAAVEEAASVAHSQAEAAEAKLSAVTDLFKQGSARVKMLERAQEDADRTIRDLEAKLKTQPAPSAGGVAALPFLNDLLCGFQALGAASTMSDVLATLVEQLAGQFPRVALFKVKKSHLQGEQQIGFDLKTDIAKVVLPLGMDSFLARAVSSGQIERLAGDELKDGNRAPFSGSPRFALAVPIAAGGETLAILYADDAGAKDKRGADAALAGAKFAEAMQHVATAVLMRMTNELKARAELQSYAQSLVRELEQMFAADEQAERPEQELDARLKSNLEYARSIFESRVSLEGTDAASLLDEEISALLDTGQGTSFARHLAAVAGHATSARSAEAS
jgi:hypothetical protein